MNNQNYYNKKLPKILLILYINKINLILKINRKILIKMKLL